MNKREHVAATDRLRICDGVSARDFDGSWVVLDLEKGNYFGLDRVGGVILQNLSAGKSPEEIARILAASFEVTEAASLRDVLRLVDELVDRGLVRVEG